MTIAAGPALQHGGQQRAGGEERAVHVRLPQLAPGVVVEFGERRGPERPRRVHEDVDAPQLPLGAGGHRLHRCAVAHVAGEREPRVDRPAGRRLAQALLAAPDERDARSGVDEALGDGPADAARRAGDDGGLAGEVHHGANTLTRR